MAAGQASRRSRSNIRQEDRSTSRRKLSLRRHPHGRQTERLEDDEREAVSAPAAMSCVAAARATQAALARMALGLMALRRCRLSSGPRRRRIVARRRAARRTGTSPKAPPRAPACRAPFRARLPGAEERGGSQRARTASSRKPPSRPPYEGGGIVYALTRARFPAAQRAVCTAAVWTSPAPGSAWSAQPLEPSNRRRAARAGENSARFDPSPVPGCGATRTRLAAPGPSPGKKNRRLPKGPAANCSSPRKRRSTTSICGGQPDEYASSATSARKPGQVTRKVPPITSTESPNY